MVGKTEDYAGQPIALSLVNETDQERIDFALTRLGVPQACRVNVPLRDRLALDRVGDLVVELGTKLKHLARSTDQHSDFDALRKAYYAVTDCQREVLDLRRSPQIWGEQG